MKKQYTLETIDEMPARKGAGMKEETKVLIESLKKHEGTVIKMTFSNKNELWKYFTRIRYAQKKGLLNFNKISRQDVSLFIDMRKENEK